MRKHQRFRMNMNDTVYIRLTDLGYEWLAEEHNDLARIIPNWPHKIGDDFKKQADAGGYTEMMFWEFIHKLGPKSSMGVLDQYMDINILMEKEVFNQQEQEND
jgi:hypothetical protein